jgi:carbamate kinase
MTDTMPIDKANHMTIPFSQKVRTISEFPFPLVVVAFDLVIVVAVVAVDVVVGGGGGGVPRICRTHLLAVGAYRT